MKYYEGEKSRRMRYVALVECMRKVTNIYKITVVTKAGVPNKNVRVIILK